MKRLFVIGDSHTTPYMAVDPVDSFWGLFASELGIEQIVNVSKWGNSFDSVCQLLVAIQNEYNYDWQNDYFIIGMPALERITVFDDHADTKYPGWFINCKDWSTVDAKIQAHRGLICKQFYGEDRLLTIHADRSWLETQTLRQVFLLTQWLDSNNSRYLICNLTKPLDKNNLWGPSEFVLDYTLNHPKCLLFGETLFSINYGVHLPADARHSEDWHAHHGPDGNKRYFDLCIKPKLEELNYII